MPDLQTCFEVKSINLSVSGTNDDDVVEDGSGTKDRPGRLELPAYPIELRETRPDGGTCSAGISTKDRPSWRGRWWLAIVDRRLRERERTYTDEKQPSQEPGRKSVLL